MPSGVFVRTAETRRKISLSSKGRLISAETRQKMSEAKKGKPNGRLGKFLSEITKQKIGLASKGRYRSEESRRKNGAAHRGKRLSIETRRKMSEAHAGPKCHLWKGGLTPENARIRHSIGYRLWREAVFARDNFTCQECGKRGGQNINAHHIKEFAECPELRTSIDNGITFCERCHSALHKKRKEG